MYKRRKRHINGPHIDIVIFNITLKAAEPLLAAFLIFFLLKFKIYLNPWDLYTGFLGSCFITSNTHNKYKIYSSVASSPYKVHKLILFKGEYYAILVCLYSTVVINIL